MEFRIQKVYSHPDSSLSSLQSFTPSHLHVIAIHWVLDVHVHWNSPHFSGVTLQSYAGREVDVWLYGADVYLAIMLNLLIKSTCMPTLFGVFFVQVYFKHHKTIIATKRKATPKHHRKIYTTTAWTKPFLQIVIGLCWDSGETQQSSYSATDRAYCENSW